MFHIRSASGHGCYFDNIFIGCMIYADGFFYCYLDHCVTYRQYGGICCEELEKDRHEVKCYEITSTG